MDSPEIQSAPESKLHFLDYWRIIRIRKVIIISIFFITTVIATVVTFLMRPSYSSNAEIEIEPDSAADIVGFNNGSADYSPYDPYFMETQVKIIQGDVIMTRVVNDLDLDDVWGKKFNGDGGPLKTSDAVDLLRHYISLDADRNTKLVNVTVRNEDPKMAAKIANELVDAYKNYRQEEHEKRMAGGIQKLQEEYQNEESAILAMQSNVDQLRATLGIVDSGTSPEPTPTITADQMHHYSELLIEGNADYIKMQNQLDELQALQATNPVVLRDVLPAISPDDALSDLLNKLRENEQKYVTETNYIGQKNPDLETTLSLISTLNGEIDSRVQGIMLTLQDKVSSQKAALDEIRAEVHNAETSEQDELVRGQPYWEAKRVLQGKLSLHDMLAAKIETQNADLIIPHSMFVTVVNPAVPAQFPDRPTKSLNITLGAIFGLLVGVGLAFFIEYLDTSVKTIDEVERVFQTPVLGVIPQNVGTLIDQGMDSSHAEAYRVLRTNILFSRKDENFNSLVVISAGMGEGKSTTAINLATVFAQAGQRTLVVDSDLRRPTLHKLLRLSNNMGLVNYLLKQNTLEEVIQTTTVPLLNFLASGKLPGGSLNILGSGQMKSLIGELKQRYDFVVFDSPPIMGLSDASVLASEIDMAIQVIQYRRYPQLMNIRAKQMVEKVGGNLVGIVLNNINMAQDESYYYYGGYEYHSSDESGGTPASKPSGDTERVDIQQKY